MAREGFLKDKCGPRAKKFEHHGVILWNVVNAWAGSFVVPVFLIFLNAIIWQGAHNQVFAPGIFRPLHALFPVYTLLPCCWLERSCQFLHSRLIQSWPSSHLARLARHPGLLSLNWKERSGLISKNAFTKRQRLEKSFADASGFSKALLTESI